MTYADEVKRKLEKRPELGGRRRCYHLTLRAAPGAKGLLWECQDCLVLWGARELEMVDVRIQPPTLERGKSDPFSRAAAEAHLTAVAAMLVKAGVSKAVRAQWVAGHAAGFAVGWDAALASSKRVVVPVDLDALSAEIRAPFDPKRAVRS